MTRRAAIAALAVAFAAFAQARGEWVTEVVTNRVEYDGVEYLQSSGTQYIDTGIIGTMDISVVIRARAIEQNVSPGLLGSRIGYRNRDITIGRMGASDSTCTFGYGEYEGGSSKIISNVQWNDLEWHTCSITKGGYLRIDNWNSQVTTTSFTTPSTLRFFGFYNNGSMNLGKGCVQYCRIWDNEELVRDLIPVLDGTTPKMLNLVDGQLYANAGTGSFTYGSITGKVAYVSVTTNRVYRAPAPMRSYDAQHPFNAPTARTRLGGTGSGEDGTTLRPTAHFDIKRNEED